MYIYKKTEPRLWTVGYLIVTKDGEKFNPESDHPDEESARMRVSFLNGGNAPSEKSKNSRKIRYKIEFMGGRDGQFYDLKICTIYMQFDDAGDLGVFLSNYKKTLESEGWSQISYIASEDNSQLLLKTHAIMNFFLAEHNIEKSDLMRKVFDEGRSESMGEFFETYIEHYQDKFEENDFSLFGLLAVLGENERGTLIKYVLNNYDGISTDRIKKDYLEKK